MLLTITKRRRIIFFSRRSFRNVLFKSPLNYAIDFKRSRPVREYICILVSKRFSIDSDVAVYIDVGRCLSIASNSGAMTYTRLARIAE